MNIMKHLYSPQICGEYLFLSPQIVNFALWEDSPKWAKICGCSQDTALRDINDLISKGMLCDSGEGGRSANYILPDILR